MACFSARELCTLLSKSTEIWICQTLQQRVRLWHYLICVSAAAFDSMSARRDFLSYALSLMRAHNAEHSDTLPILDVCALRHVAYILDALVYYMRSGSDADDTATSGIASSLNHPPPSLPRDVPAQNVRDFPHTWHDADDILDDADVDDATAPTAVDADSIDGDSDAGGKTGRKHPFFQRSDSTTFLGCPPPDPFKIPLVEAVPLADQPHLLQPSSRREELFGMPRQAVLESSLVGQPSPFDRLPTHMALSVRSAGTGFNPSFDTNAPTPTPAELALVGQQSTGGVIVRPQPPPPSAPQLHASHRLVSMTTNMEMDSPASPQPEPQAPSTSRPIPMETSENRTLENSVIQQESSMQVENSVQQQENPVNQQSVIVHAGSSMSHVQHEREQEEGELKDEEELTKEAESIIQAPVAQGAAGPSNTEHIERWVSLLESREFSVCRCSSLN